MPTPKQKDKSIRVGLLVAVALVVLMIFLFFIGSEQKIFSRKNEYEVRFDSVAGLAEGNPVKISGVTVGVVKDIKLPRDPKAKDVDISLMVDRKYAERIRGDSRARLKKLGLLAGDSYIDITPGSPASISSSRDRSSRRSGRRTSISSSPRARTSSTTSCRSRIR
jgi:phospholipid/cholesterol/gamma-HCH transport system substrate-binding protein